MNRRGISGKARRPVKEASGKLKNRRKLTSGLVVKVQRTKSVANWRTMKPKRTANSLVPNYE
jgi:hypothetical protein